MSEPIHVGCYGSGVQRANSFGEISPREAGRGQGEGRVKFGPKFQLWTASYFVFNSRMVME